MAYPPPEVQYERDLAVNYNRRGPLRFEEGIATDTDVPFEFGRGAYGDTAGDNRGRSFTVIKDPMETMRERVHMGSSTWIEAPAMLSDFVYGAHAGMGMPEFELELGSEYRLLRPNIANVTD
jgi:hypothetical protein